MTPRYKKSQREEAMLETRGALLKAAAAEFAQNGYEGANINRIATAAGFSIGTVYNYFPSKRELMLAFIDEVGQMHVSYIVQEMNQATDPIQRLRNFFKAGFEFVEMNIEESRAIFNALNGPDDEFRQRLFLAYAPLFAALSSDILNEGVERGNFRTDLPATASGLIMLIYLGTSSQLSLEGKHWVDNETVADFVLHALQNKDLAEAL